MKSKTYYKSFKCSRCDLQRSETNKHLFYNESSSSSYCRACNNDLVRERRKSGKLKKEPQFSDYDNVESWYRAHGTKGMNDSSETIVKTMKSIWRDKWTWSPDAKRVEMGIVMQWSAGCLRPGWIYKDLNLEVKQC